MMNPLLIDKLNKHPELLSDEASQQYTITDVSWETYEALLTDLGDNFPGLRVHYLKGVLEITMPSRQHEVFKENIRRLLGVYFEETRTRFYSLGSTTFRSEAKRRGAEPDLSFCIGTDKALPDIAIAVVKTSGEMDKLAIYQGLSVAEVWFWQDNHFTLYHLGDQGYEQREFSQFLPNFDLNLLASYVTYSEPLDAVLEYRQALSQRRG
ncbi:MAG: Uma2 family endonuclease [Cyanobacteria bacterium]|jgi:Uma2 family endonuclease|nr:Uma2 family endonuclease [Cyanobacteria bacterium GSL.Bin21]